MPTQQTCIRLLVLFGAALAGAIVVSLFQKNHSYFFEVNLSSNRAETAKVTFDLGNGSKESRCFQHKPGSPIYRFALPTGLYSRLGFIPLSDEGSAVFRNARIIDRNGQLVRGFDPNDFRPQNQIANSMVSDGAITVQTVPHATSPSFEVLIGAPFRLEKLGFDLIFNVIRALPAFVIFLLGGLAAGVVPGFLTWARRIFRFNQIQFRKSDQHGDTPSTHSYSTWLGWTHRHQTSLTVFAAGLILFFRLPDRFLNPQFWAEDGYFFTEALRGGLKSLLTPYGGYQLLVPRLAEIVATKISLLYAPLFLNLAAFAIALVVVSRVLSQRSQLSYRPLLALAIVLIPRPEDIFLTIENIQWIMAIGFILLLISSDACSLKQRLYDYCAVCLCGLTGVFAVLLLPFFALRALQRKTLHSTVLLTLVTAAALFQLWFVAHNPPLYAEHASSNFNYHLVPVVIGYQLFVRLFGGEWLPQLSTAPLLIAGFLVLLYWCNIWLRQNGSATKRLTQRILMLAMVAALAASIYRFKYVLFIFATPEHIARYFLIPQVLFIWLLTGEFSQGLVRRSVAFILLFAFLFNTLTFFRAEPLWDYDWPKCVRQISEGKNVTVPINPAGWYFQYLGQPR